jgi:16S rRNA processing protein RimM
VRYFADAAEDLLSIEHVALGRDEADREAERFEVEEVVPGRRGELRLRLVGISDRDAAEALRGRAVLVEPRELRPLPEGEYYEYQLLGCRVEGEDGRVVGTVRGVWETGAADVLVVEDEAGERHLVPAAAELLREVDPAGRRIVVDLPPGLVDGEAL